MDPVSIGAGLIAFFQIADRVIQLCKFYIESLRDAPHDLRVILIEVTSLKGILENLDYLLKVDPNLLSDATPNHWCRDGTLDACQRCLTQLEALFPSGTAHNGSSISQGNRNKRQRISQVATVLAWPLKEGRARKLLQEVSRHKATITLALSAESRYVLRSVSMRQHVLSNSSSLFLRLFLS